MIKLYLKLDNSIKKYKPEIKYVLDLMSLNYALEITTVSHEADIHLYYGKDKLENHINIPLKIFDRIYDLSDNGIFPDNKKFKSLITNELKLIDYSDNTIGEINYDFFAIVFSLVSRIEERSKEKKLDNYNRYSINSDILATNKLLKYAPVDYVMEDLASLIFKENKIIYNTKYNIIPTHDVDKLKSYHHPILPFRYAIGDLLKRFKPISAFKRFFDYFPGEPKKSFNFLMDQSEKYNLKSRFLFMGPSNETQDSKYCSRYPNILKNTVKSILKRGHIVGFHPGYLTYKDEFKWKKQKHGLEQLINTKVTEGRQHMLQYSIENTPQIWEKNRMQREYTLSYPEEPGFRNGTSRPVVQYDLTTRKKMNLLSISTSIMDFGLLGGKYNNYSCSEALNLCTPIIKTCKRFNGSLVILMHTGRNFKNSKRFYSKLLKLANKI